MKSKLEILVAALLLLWMVCFCAASDAIGAEEEICSSQTRARLLGNLVAVQFSLPMRECDAVGLAVGMPGEPAQYVIVDDWYLYNNMGMKASRVTVTSLMYPFEEYAVDQIYEAEFSHILLLRTEHPISGSDPFPLADAASYAENEKACISWIAADDLNGIYIGVDSGHFLPDALLTDLSPNPLLPIYYGEGRPLELFGASLTEDGYLAGFSCDSYDADAGVWMAYPAREISELLDYFSVPYRVSIDDIAWQDEEFARMLKEALGGAICREDLLNVRSLEIRGRRMTLNGGLPDDLSLLEAGRVSSLADIAAFPNLETICVIGQPMSDLAPLALCGGLRKVALCHNEIQDLAPLAQISGLTELYLYGNRIENISPLAELFTLEALGLGDNVIVDIEPLSDLTRLTFLRLHNNCISDISPLQNLVRLEDLSLSGNNISDISPLLPLSRLMRLKIRDNSIIDISPLASLKRLILLDVTGNLISDASPLAELPALDTLYIADNPLKDPVTLPEIALMEGDS